MNRCREDRGSVTLVTTGIMVLAASIAAIFLRRIDWI